MANLSAFFPRLIPYAPGVSEPLAQQALLDAAIDFCERSYVVTQDLDPMTLPAGTDTVELEPPTGTVVAAVTRAWFDERLLQATPAAHVFNPFRPDGRPVEYYGAFIDDVYCLTVHPAPDETKPNALLVRVALKPSRSATTVPTLLFDHYADAIVDGALGILLAVPDQPFSNEAKAFAMAQMARSKAAQAKADSLRGRVQSSMRVKMRTF